MADRTGLQIIGLVLAGLTSGSAMIAGALVYTTVSGNLLLEQSQWRAQQMSAGAYAQSAQRVRN